MTDLFDIAIVGGGIAGAATAEYLGRRDVSTLLIEQFEAGHTRGSSHGDGRIIRYAYTRRHYAEMMVLAYPAWEALNTRAGEQLMQRSGGIDIGKPDTAGLLQIEQNFNALGISYDTLDGREAAERFPQFHFQPEARILYQADGGACFATRSVKALWRLAEAKGVVVATGTRVTEIRPGTSFIVLRDDSGREWTARRVIVTAGAWTRPLLSGLGQDIPLCVTQEQVVYLAPRRDVRHTLGEMPVFIDHERNFYGLPIIEVSGVKIGFDGSGPVIDPDNRVEPSPESIGIIQEFAAERLPHLQPAPLEVVTCLYTTTPDHDFIYDRVPQYPNIIVGTACSGTGFKFGPLHGEILASLALDEPPPVPLEPFRLGRFG